MQHITFAEAKKLATALGYTIRRSRDGEYRVNEVGGMEATAYYASDLPDAVGTMRAMSAVLARAEQTTHQIETACRVCEYVAANASVWKWQRTTVESRLTNVRVQHRATGSEWVAFIPADDTWGLGDDGFGGEGGYESDRASIAKHFGILAAQLADPTCRELMGVELLATPVAD